MTTRRCTADHMRRSSTQSLRAATEDVPQFLRPLLPDLSVGPTETRTESSMPKGQLCPVCKRYTLKPCTTNQLRCSADKTIVKK